MNSSGSSKVINGTKLLLLRKQNMMLFWKKSRSLCLSYQFWNTKITFRTYIKRFLQNYFFFYNGNYHHSWNIYCALKSMSKRNVTFYARIDEKSGTFV